MFLIYLWFVGIVFIIGGFCVQPSDHAPGFFLAGGIILLGAFFLTRKKINKLKTTDDASHNASYDDKSRTLEIHGFSPSNRHILKISSVLDISYKYHDAELVYTGATVGGVHAGGFHVNKAYLSPQARRSGKYELVYIGKVFDKGYYPIKEIVLSDEMAEKAKSISALAEFLDGNRLTLRHKVKSTVSEELYRAKLDYQRQNRLDISAEIGKQDYLASQLTKEECAAIVGFLSQGDGNVSTAEKDVQSIGISILSFLIPIVGIIIWLTNRNTRPLRAKAALRGAILGWIFVFSRSIFKIVIPLIV